MTFFRLLTVLTALLPLTAIADEQISFNRDVRPILSDKCFHCHGPDAAERQADLRLDQEDSAKQDREGYAAIVPHDPNRSEVIRRILTDDSDLQMPPADSGRSLTQKQKQTLIEWVRQGAAWEQHWAFVSPARPNPPTTQNTDWPGNEIDHFVLHRMQEHGLQPSPPADRAKWLRRVTFDLTGLPPTIEELDDYLNDRSTEADERVVDRLLASPRYGEHMAAMWLDAARYADTDGYQNDGPRTMYRWRDWVIDAYNANMPFDQFTIEQLAGDLLPDATLSQKIATGFNRNHRYNSEAGLVLEEFLLENAVDRVDTTATVWMGLTAGCARCHDHKYDPISQQEYYQMIAFFDRNAEAGRAIKFGNSEPWVIAPTEAQQRQLETIDQRLAMLQTELVERRAKVAEILRTNSAAVRTLADHSPSHSQAAVVRRGLQHHFPFEDKQAEGIAVEAGQPVLRTGLTGQAATVGGNGILSLGKKGDVQCHKRSSISFWLKTDGAKDGVILSRQEKSTRRPGFAVELKNGRLQFYIITRWVAGVGAIEATQAIPVGKWVHVALTNDGTQRAKGQQIWINGQLADSQILMNTNSNTGGTSAKGLLRVGGGVVGPKFAGQVDDLRFYDRTLFANEIETLAVPSTIADLLQTPFEQQAAAEQNKLLNWIAETATLKDIPDQPSPVKNGIALLQQSIAAFEDTRQRRIKLVDSFPTSMVMEDAPNPRPTTVRVRGVYNNHGEVVDPGTPEVLPPFPDSNEPARLRFAKWLVSGRHPLTARVTVNRYWQKYFGAGLVRSPNDFGLQGDLPTHPDLLDWLAVEFADSGWDVKQMQKLIVLSATYRQDSRFNAETKDPQNHWLSRGPRRRLTARQLRDQALFVSGLLTSEIGGPSVSPYQPTGLWAEMSNMKYRQSKGKDLYRRGLYTIWKRTVAPPSLAVLDAADRETCTVRLKKTNTPLQALTLLNETTFVEAARHLAIRMRREGDDDPVGYAFRLVTSRQPTDEERVLLNNARSDYEADFRSDPDRAAALLQVGESEAPADGDPIQLAADTLLCNVLLNLDESLTRE